MIEDCFGAVAFVNVYRGDKATAKAIVRHYRADRNVPPFITYIAHEVRVEEDGGAKCGLLFS